MRRILAALAFAVALSAPAAGVFSTQFSTDKGQLRLELLNDSLVHFEYSARATGTKRIATSPMVERTEYAGPTRAQRNGATITTPELTIAVEPDSLCFVAVAKTRKLTQVCPRNLASDWKGLTLTAEGTKNLYGLGQQFRRPGKTDGDWMNAVRTPGDINGNKMVEFNHGFNGNTQVPILYALGASHASYALFLDSTYKQQWDFHASPWTVETWGDQIHGYLFSGDSLPALRKAYLDLVGRPLVPPKKAFGLWVSEYGYHSWGEMDSKLATLRQNHFPLDGFMLDLYWYGGITSGSDDSPMGKLTWDPVNFPDARAKLSALREQQGVGVIPIEEPYIAKNLTEHRELAEKGFLVKDASGKPAYLVDNPWWGKGGFVDFSNPEANAYWHKAKRVRLIEDGITGFWTDLGEPELYPPDGRYHGGHEADVHNLYNFYWLQGLYAGYQKYTPNVRPFMVSRSGTAGIQRFGAGMWSGDIGSDITSLASHLNAQMHLSLSGIDYYGADIGGFHREALHGDLNDTYTRWFADGTLFDVPVRPHTENLCHCKETAPDRVGDLASNRRNLRQRYQLIPYLYSLAHHAHEDGEPVFPPLVYHFESDTKARLLGGEKMIGPWLLARATARNGEKAADVYLPAGRWYEFHDDRAVDSRGQTLANVALYRDGQLVPPLYARAGAILPMMAVDEATMNALGKRADGTRHDELRARIYPDRHATSFELVEDDGETTAYLRGELRRTVLSQSRGTDGVIAVSIAPARGDYDGAPSARDAVLELVGVHAPESVTLNDRALPRAQKASSAASWWVASGRVYVRTGALPVDQEKRLILR